MDEVSCLFTKNIFPSRWHQAGSGRLHLLLGARGQGVELRGLEHHNRLLRGHPHWAMPHPSAARHLAKGSSCPAHLDHLRTVFLLRDQRGRKAVHRESRLRASHDLTSILSIINKL